MALKCIVPVKSSGRQSMLSKDPVTENSHLRYFCKVVLQRCRSVCNIDDSEPRCGATGTFDTSVQADVC